MTFNGRNKCSSDVVKEWIERTASIFLHEAGLAVRGLGAVRDSIRRGTSPVRSQLGALGIYWDGSCLDESNELWIQRNASQKGDAKVIGHQLAPSRREDVGALAAMWTHEPGHVLNDAQDGDARLGAEIQLLAHVGRCDGLRCSDHDGTRELTRPSVLQQTLGERDVLIRCPGWCIDEQVVELAPEHIRQKLSDHRRFLGSSPHDGITPVS